MHKYQDDDRVVHLIEGEGTFSLYYDKCGCGEPNWNMLRAEPSTVVTCLGCLASRRKKTLAERIATEPAQSDR